MSVSVDLAPGRRGGLRLEHPVLVAAGGGGFGGELLEAVADLPLVITATTSRAPVFEGGWLARGALVCAIGSNWLHKAEIDSGTVSRAGLVVCDSVACCQREAGDLAQAVETGAFDWSRAVDLADVVAGRYQPPADPQLTVFKSVGMAIEDVALAARLLADQAEG